MMTPTAPINAYKCDNWHIYRICQNQPPQRSVFRSSSGKLPLLLAIVLLTISRPDGAAAAECLELRPTFAYRPVLRIASAANSDVGPISRQDVPTEQTAEGPSLVVSHDRPYATETTTKSCNGVRLQDEITLISTRSVGCSCDPNILRTGLRCQQYAICDSVGCRTWQSEDLMNVLAAGDPDTYTVIFVHGNRVAPGEDKRDGLMVYRKLLRCCSDDRPIRLIIFSWPSTEIRGPLRDVRVKAARTRPVGYQLAWAVDQIPGETPLSYIGYSYGSRVITGALHLLGGGDLNGLRLGQRVNLDRSPARAMLIASALNANWLGSGQYHGLAMSQVNHLLLVNNRCDPVMRWYHLSTACGTPQALGLAGPTCIGEERCKICNRDVGRYVGAHHDMQRYLSAPGIACEYQRYASW